jgi:alpha-L-arabinofuranosidase
MGNVVALVLNKMPSFLKITKPDSKAMKTINRRSRLTISFITTLPVLLIYCYLGRELSAQSFIKVDVSKPGVKVADICRGQQIEEFNYQIEGGLYAQLIKNPSFEELDDPLSDWKIVKAKDVNATISGCTSLKTNLLNANQEHCLKLNIVSSGSRAGIANSGYWGMKFENNTLYKISFWAKCSPNFKGTLKASLESNAGAVYAQSEDFTPGNEWKHFVCDLMVKGVSKVSGENRFVIYASSPGEVYLDVITLMPPAWKNRSNGLRRDLAEMLSDLKLKYIQFPGGCTAESYKMDTCWNWKGSIGPLEQRAGSTRNRWGYKNDLYFGLDEHLQLCEDLGAEPVYVTSSGISETGGPDRWFGICPLDKMGPIIADILDLLQYCKGPVSSVWGARRAANGHPSPYHLVYLEIGNENGWETVKEYIPRYNMIRDSILKHYPDMKIMFNGYRQENIMSHTFGASVDYTDEHFYLQDLSVLYNKYDSIDPACRKICVAEYASSVKGNGGNVIGNFGDALGDAAFMLGCEKNSERIWWTGYGNYAGLMDHGNFGPCIVWNDAVSCFGSPSYYMQKMLFSDNQGTNILPFTFKSENCYWSASFDNSSGRNDVLIKAVNMNDKPETVKIIIDGTGSVKREGVSFTLSGNPEDENSIIYPKKIYPKKANFEAGKSFIYVFPASSVTVLRVGISTPKTN